jgi:type II secretory pathway pseudopilin PulG
VRLVNNIYKKNYYRRGFSSLAEIVLVTGILSVLFSIGIFSLTRSQQSTSLLTTVDIFKSDFKNQQLKAMLGDTDAGTAPDNYGINLSATSYTLFKGNDPALDPNKFVVNLPSTIRITENIPSDNIIFFKGSGVVAGCCSLVNFTVTFNDQGDNIEKTFTIGRHGSYTIN